MHISEVDFCPQKDQWWARLKPLALIRILETPAPNECLAIEVYSPDEPYGSVWNLVCPIGAPTFRCLWSRMPVPTEWFPGARTGDARALSNGQVFFLVKNDDNITVLSDTALSDDDIVKGSRLIQQGPERPQGETLFDKLRGDHQTLLEPTPTPVKQIELEPLPVEQPKQAGGLRPDLNRAGGLSLIPNRPTTY